jgi:2-methylisocitrate lyase-like PEP mutase family enzyme
MSRGLSLRPDFRSSRHERGNHCGSADPQQGSNAYLEAGADCVYPITLWERDVLGSFVADVGSPVNILATLRAPAIADLAELGVARISWAGSLYRGAMEWLAGKIASLADDASQAGLPLRSLS